MKTLFALLMLITIAASGWMSWLSRDFILNDGSKFSIMHLELPEDNIAVNKLIAGFAAGTKGAVVKQLNTDYIFMAGCYPGIMVLCLIALGQITTINTLQKDLHKKPTGKGWNKILLALALLQLLAWGLDEWENAEIESWLNAAVADDAIGFFKARTFLKFGIGIAGFLTATFVLGLTVNLPKKLTKQKLVSTSPKQKNIRPRHYTS